jgi:hypothetical protein
MCKSGPVWKGYLWKSWLEVSTVKFSHQDLTGFISIMKLITSACADVLVNDVD